jgi:hypothetical protein
MFSNPVSKKSNITEANKHLHLLYERVSDLEKTVEEQSTLIAQKDGDHQEQIATLLAMKESETNELNQRLEASESLVHDLHQQIDEKNSLINRLQRRADVLNDLLAYKPMLEKMLLTMTYGRDDVDEELPSNTHAGQSREYLNRNSQEHSTPEIGAGANSETKNSGTELSLEWPQPYDNGYSPIQEMVNHFGRNVRQFSISNEDDEDSSGEPSMVH